VTPDISREGVGDEPKQPITVLADRVLVQVPHAEGERRSRAGILIRPPPRCPAVWPGPKRSPSAPRADHQGGDNVLFNPEDQYEVEMHGDEYLILRERDIHAVASTRIDGGTGLYL